ncbi:hypothetical protein ACIPWL_16850 [Streptomyces sp. NPDC090023]|uniref:hypothetical protein n=1 Tax=unclassified Streptomyces TaxID=2593676 RepID=UPI0038072DD8
MFDRPLPADIPLGPFQGQPIPVFSAKGKNAKLHARLTCTRLRSDGAVTSEVPLNADTIGRMCSSCGLHGDWGRPDSGVGLFLRALGGIGLLYQLQQYTETDPDCTMDQKEIERAAEVLRTEPIAEEDEEHDDEDWEVRDAAGRLREEVVWTWRDAARSLHLAQTTVAAFPWLADWARPKVAPKEQYLETLRGLAALFVTPAGLLAAAAAASMDEPELPSGESAFAAIGDSKEVTRRLRSMWVDWQNKARSSWVLPGDSLFTHDALHGIRQSRKGYAEARLAVGRLLASWEEEARRVADAADTGVTVAVTVHLLEIQEDETHWQRRHERGLLADFDDWMIGVLLVHLTRTDWGHRQLTVRVPQLIADRLLSQSSLPHCELATATPEAAAAVDETSPLSPGVFDDTAVHQRRPLTADHLRLLCSIGTAEDELYIVFSTGGGTEVLPFPELERRASRGWRGVLIASSADLPAALIDPWSSELGKRPEDRDSWWPERIRNADDPAFGERLGLNSGAQQAAWMVFGDEARQRERHLRLLAVARGVRDLRSLDAGYDHAGRSRGLPSAVWHGLLAPGSYLDLKPFEAPGRSGWKRGGSGIPLGVLADVQVYAANADPRFQGKGHSPFCSHTRERGVVADDDLLTVADLLDGQDFDWCGRCSGYAVRRLTDVQLAHYRAAHRLHDIARQMDPDRGGYDPGRFEQLAEQLRGLEKWDPDGEGRPYSEDARQWRSIVRELQSRGRPDSA